MHNAICKELFDTLGSIGIHERHVQRLLLNPTRLQFSVKYALGLAELDGSPHEPLSAHELPSGGLAIRQPVEPLPFDVKDWQIYFRQRNAMVPEHMRYSMEPAKQGVFTDEAFSHPLASDVSTIVLVDTAQARIRPEQAHELIADIAPESASRTHPMLTFEVLRYFWDEFNNLNAAYIIINAVVEGVGYPVIFNTQSRGKRVTFVPGVPQQHEQYTGYYACCA